jgi:centromere protein C
MEDMDEVFDSAKTPDKTTEAALDEYEKSSALVVASAKKARGKVKKPAEVRMSLPGAPEEEDDDDDDESKSSAVKPPSNYVKSVLAGKNVHFSPSNLSHVSTAPPTPREETESEEEEEDVEETRAEPLTEQEEEHVVSQTAKATTPQHAPGVAAASPEAFSVGDDDEEDEDQDLLPPNPPEHEDDQESAVKSVEEQPVAFPDGDDAQDDDDEEEEAPEATTVADHEMENNDDSGDDDEGAGYNMVHDPETPHSVREERKRKEREEMEKKRKEGKRGRPRKSLDSEAKTPARASKKTKKRNVVFSPQGYPIGNRDYTEVPVSDLIEPSPSDPNLRRSRRARTAPLNFWKNEKQVFGAHEEDGDIGEAMGDMPVVKKVLRALPTPYRKRTVTEGAKKRPGRPKTATGQPEEFTPFDARKLRKKYNVVDGEMAQIWDAGADDIADMSKWQQAAESFFRSILFTLTNLLCAYFLQRLFRTPRLWCQATCLWERRGKNQKGKRQARLRKLST